MGVRRALQLILVAGLAAGLISAIMFGIAAALELLSRRKLHVVGPLAPLEANRWYIFKAREAPERPVVEVRVLLHPGLAKARIRVSNYLDRDVKGTVSLSLYSGEDVVASGSAEVEVRSRESVALEICLSWREGLSPSDADWGVLEATFLIQPRFP